MDRSSPLRLVPGVQFQAHAWAVDPYPGPRTVFVVRPGAACGLAPVGRIVFASRWKLRDRVPFVGLAVAGS
jgi:hypothetical protein